MKPKLKFCLKTVRNFRTVQKEGSKNISRELKHFNLDAIISVGYHVNSIQVLNLVSRISLEFKIAA
ncbi:RhuM family protein [Flavobacterium sp. ZS1P14]|uniref:RhuM family protein n=1 Tax=Flavobacterium sp. ZS1P14 TaxID=3401729 RepID=UPI003AAA58A1